MQGGTGGATMLALGASPERIESVVARPFTMTPIEFAARLEGRQIGNEITPAEDEQAREAGLVVIFGYSDDLIELRGAIRDEASAYNGTTLHLHRAGLIGIIPFSECERCHRRSRRAAELCRAVRCHWDYRCASDDTRWSWWIEADGGKLGAGFTILDEDGDRYCRGLVLAIADLPVVPPEAMP